jgi:hypothetical protein
MCKHGINDGAGPFWDARINVLYFSMYLSKRIRNIIALFYLLLLILYLRTTASKSFAVARCWRSSLHMMQV